MDYTKRDQLIDTIHDVYKDIHGVRPRHLNLHEKTEEELAKILALLAIVEAIES
jgi:hypothetical protein